MARISVSAPWWDGLLGNCLKFAVSCTPIATRRARVVIKHKDEVLLVMGRFAADNQLWVLPGGGCKHRESAEDCAVREVREEVSIDLSLTRLEKVGSHTKRLGLFRADTRIFAALVDSRDFSKNGRELLDARWFELGSLPSNLEDVTKTTLNQI